MKILVTGGAGFIGSHVVDAYQAAGHEVAILDNFSSGKRENISKSETIVYEADITDGEAVKRVLAEFQPEVINHHAAQISVTYSVREPLDDARRNVLGTLAILEGAIATPSVRKVIYASSGGAMYGDPVELPCKETTAPAPMSPYGLSKYVAEQYVWLYQRLHGLKATVLRYSNVYGPRQDPHGEAGVCAIFAPNLLAGKPVTIFGDGTQKRDYVFVGDVAAANFAALDKGDDEAFNISTGVATSTRQVFEAIRNAAGYTDEPVNAAARPGEIQDTFISPMKAEKGLGWSPRHDFYSGIAKTITWYRGHLLG